MSIDEIEKMLLRRNELTEAEKSLLRDAILKNDQARNRVINGFIKMGEYSKAHQVSIWCCS